VHTSEFVCKTSPVFLQEHNFIPSRLRLVTAAQTEKCSCRNTWVWSRGHNGSIRFWPDGVYQAGRAV